MSSTASSTTPSAASESRRYLIDSNVLLRFIEEGHPHQDSARQALQLLAESRYDLHLVPQTVIEFWGVATRPAAARGGLSLTPAQAQIVKFKTALPVLADPPEVFSQWERLAASYKVSGKQVHDTRLVAAMKVHGLTHLLTFNEDDFRRFEAGEGIAIINPATVASTPTSTSGIS